jgi:hypothetical protein
LVFLLHGPEGVDKFLDDLEGLFNSITVLLVTSHLCAICLSLMPFSLQVLLQLDHLVGKLLDLLLVYMGEVVNVRIVKLLD